jgi:hypothetical protein
MIDILQATILAAGAFIAGFAVCGLWYCRRIEMRIRKQYAEWNARVFVLGEPFSDGHPPRDFIPTHQHTEQTQH